MPTAAAGIGSELQQVRVRADQRRLARVFPNPLDKAARHAKSTIKIRMERRPGEALVSVDNAERSSALKIAIRVRAVRTATSRPPRGPLTPSSPQHQHSLSVSACGMDGRVGAWKGQRELKLTDLDLRRKEIRSGRWGSGLRSVSSGSSALSSSRCF
jgi:hypothetical protein